VVGSSKSIKARASPNQSKDHFVLPVHLVDKISKMRRTADEVAGKKLGHEPTDEELGRWKWGNDRRAARGGRMRQAAIPPRVARRADWRRRLE